MKTTIIQHDILWKECEANLSRLEGLIESAGPADLYILPEMFSYGFVTEPEGVAEPASGMTLKWMKSMASRTGAAICGSIPTVQRGRYYNRMHFITPSGVDAVYDKKHLFTYGGEHLRFTPGDHKTVVTYCGVRIFLQVCYDLRFPVFSRNNDSEPYDMAIYVASWPSSRAEAWKALLKARAIENQCYVAGVNRVGDDPSCSYSGDSVLIDPYGNTIAACTPGKECMATGEIDMDILEAFRKKFPVLGDADR